MSLEKHILKNLQWGQASADALAENLGKDKSIIESILRRLVKEGQLTTYRISDILTVYRLP
jgi:predicted transcriptional regulator